MKAKVTVIIPCYNQGHFLSDALASLAQCDPDSYLVTIVDDGSTDPATLLFLEQLDPKSFNIIHQDNKGLSGARNTGIKHANTDFVLMLDADNKIRSSFLEKGTTILEQNPQIAVVYGDGQFFGDMTGTRKQAQFNLQKQMLVNYIDACAIIRKSVFEDVGDFDENMKDGWEDWEMWLRIAFRGYKFHYLDEVVFDYRIRKESMSKQVYDNKTRTNNIENYVYGKYPDKMGISYVVDFMVDRFRRNPIMFIFKLFIRTYFPGYYDRLLKKNKIRNGL